MLPPDCCCYSFDPGRVTRHLRMSSPATCAMEVFAVELPALPPGQQTLRVRVDEAASAADISDAVTRACDAAHVPLPRRAGLAAALAAAVQQRRRRAQHCVPVPASGAVDAWKALQRTAAATTSSSAGTEAPADQLTASEFARVYRWLVCASEHSATLLKLEHMYALAVQDVVRSRDAALADLAAQQRADMQQAMAVADAASVQQREAHHSLHAGAVGGRSRASAAVLSHDQIKQLVQHQRTRRKQLLTRWDSELIALRRVQRDEYRDFVLKQLRGLAPAAPSPRAALAALPPSALYVAPDATPTLPPVPPAAAQHHVFQVQIGAQRKTKYTLQLISGSVMHSIGPAIAAELQRAGMSPTHAGAAAGAAIGSAAAGRAAVYARLLYSQSTWAAVMLTDPQLRMRSRMYQRFARACDAATEFHFDPWSQQRDCMRQLLRPHAGVGAVAVSTHSNLFAAHVVYHVAVPARVAAAPDGDSDASDAEIDGPTTSTTFTAAAPSHGPAPDSAPDVSARQPLQERISAAPVNAAVRAAADALSATPRLDVPRDNPVRSGDAEFRALGRVIASASASGVVSLALPLLLLEPDTADDALDPVAVSSDGFRRAETVLKAVKAALASLRPSACQLAQLQLYVPVGHDQAAFRKYRQLVASLFALS